MNLIKDKKSKSKSYYLGNKFFVFSNKIILNKLKKLSNNFQYQARICLHRKKSDKLHQMIIYQPKNLNKIIKKHPKKDKSYLDLKSYNDATRLIAKKHNIHLIDLSYHLEQNRLYYKDSIHFTESGINEVSNIIYEYFIKNCKTILKNCSF